MSDEEDVLAMAAEDAKKKPADLTEVRDKAKELRDAYIEKAEAEDRVKSIQAAINAIEQKELIDLFNRVGIASVTVEAEGNHPAFVAERRTIYGAKIPDEHRQKALDWFENQGHGDLVKAMVTVTFGMQEHDKRLSLLNLLASNGYECRSDETIHPQTLKAFVTRELKKGHILPLDLLGAYFFDMVRIK
jgi:hypothetical protein